ncbi:MAG: NAD(P)/FAD-dependent oxidoreductase [Candidatus Acidiferrales bacterium]
MATCGCRADVFVVGGGPAGLVAAIAARRKGFSVTLADGAGPRIDKPCGEGLMPETRASLAELGIALDPSAGYPFKGIRFLRGSKQVSAEFPSGCGVGIRRPVLHAMLVARAEECGVRLLWKTPVTGITSGSVEMGDVSVQARWIVGADGSGSRVRKWAGLDAMAMRKQRYARRRHYAVKPWSDYVEIYWAAGLQAYVTPIAPEEVCVMLIAENPAGATFEGALDALPGLKERLGDAAPASRERGAITSMHTLRHVVRGNLALAGDSSGAVDAITGEGLHLAFEQARALACAMEAGDLACYERAHRRLARHPARMGKLLLLLGRNPAIQRRTLHMLAAHPALFRDLLHVSAGQASPLRTLATSMHFGWEFFTPLSHHT